MVFWARYKSTGRVLCAAAVGGVVGASPFMLWLGLDDNNPIKKSITLCVSGSIAKEFYREWRKGDNRPKRIVLIRAGQIHGYGHTCDCKVAGLPICSLKPEMDRPLTEEGKLQALRAGIALKHVVNDETCTFYTSPFKSCKQTFAYISGSFSDTDSLQYVEDPRLRNQDRGNWHPQIAADSHEDFIKGSQDVGKFFYRWPGGESAADVYDRMSSFMETMYRKWERVDRPDNFIIITHAVCIQAWIMRWFHWDVDVYERLEKFKNGQIAVMEKQSDGSYKLVTPLPCKPPIPTGVKVLASNPSSKPKD